MTDSRAILEAPTPAAPHGELVGIDARKKFKLESAAVRELSRLRPWRSFVAIACDWAVVVGCFAAVARWPHPLVWLGAALVVASRQHALLILMHEAVHYRFLKSHALADRISDLFMARPLFISTAGFRANHLPHHWYTHTDRDPDWMRKLDAPEYDFPQPLRALLRTLVRDLLGGGLVDMVNAVVILRRGAQATAEREAARGQAATPWGMLGYYAVLAAGITLAGLWGRVLLLWIVPSVTLLPFLMRLRNVCEHFGLEGDHELNLSRNYPGSFWERFFIVPHNFGYHLDHHLYPSVPYYNLRRLNRELATHPVYRAEARLVPSIFPGVMRELTRAGVPNASFLGLRRLEMRRARNATSRPGVDAAA
jgi:fatty acid desaturase